MGFAFATYEEWRATIPFTNEQIVAAMREHAKIQMTPYWVERWNGFADHIEKTGRVGKAALGAALPFLVKYCAVCGKKALYRVGCEGRCSGHRFVVQAAVARARAERNRVGDADRERAGRDQALLNKQSLQRNRNGRTRGRRK